MRARRTILRPPDTREPIHGAQQLADLQGIGDGRIVLGLARWQRVAQVGGRIAGCPLGGDRKAKYSAQLVPQAMRLLDMPTLYDMNEQRPNLRHT